MSLAEILSQMRALREQMDRDQADIERLKAERLALKLETAASWAGTRSLLSVLKSTVQPC